MEAGRLRLKILELYYCICILGFAFLYSRLEKRAR